MRLPMASWMTQHPLCSGGLELLFEGQKELDAELPEPASRKVSMALRRTSGHACCLLTCGLTWAMLAVHWMQAPAYYATQLTIRDLLPWMRDNLLTERPELFMKDDSV